MVVIRSSAKIMNMSVSQEIGEYFSELVKSLATNEVLKDMFKKFKEEIISKFERKFDEQNWTSLRGKLPSKQIQLTLIIKCDDNEQYSRRSCLRIHGIECSDDERNDNVLERVKECYEEMNLPLQDENTDRVYRIRNTCTDKNTGKK